MAKTTTQVIQSHLMKRLEGDVEGDIKANVVENGKIVLQTIHYSA